MSIAWDQAGRDTSLGARPQGHFLVVRFLRALCVDAVVFLGVVSALCVEVFIFLLLLCVLVT